MANSLGGLFIDMAVNTAQFETDMGRAAKIAEKRAKEIERAARLSEQRTKELEQAVTRSVESSARTLAKYAVSLIAVDQTIMRLKRTIDAADDMDDMAQKIGSSVESLSRIKYIAAHEGIDDITGSLVKLSKAIREAQTGDGEPAKAFRALGVSVVDSQGKLRDTDAVLRDIAKRFGETEDGIAKTNIAIALFGKSGADLVPMLNLGEAGFARLSRQADVLGVTLSSSAAASAAKFNDNLFELHAALDGLFIKLASRVVPRLAAFTDQITDPDFQRSIGEWTDKIVHLAEVLARNLPRVLELFAAIKGAQAGLSVGRLFGPVGGVVGLVAGAGVGASAADSFIESLDHMGERFKTDAERAADLSLEARTLGEEIVRLQESIRSGESFRVGGTDGLALAARQLEGLQQRLATVTVQLGAPQGSEKPNKPSALAFAAGTADKYTVESKFAEADALRPIEERIETETRLLEQSGQQWADYYDAQIAGEKRMADARESAARAGDEWLQRQYEMSREAAAIFAQQADAVGSVLGDAATAMSMFGERGFAIYKALKIAEAMVAIPSSAIKAYESALAVPVIGPALAPVAAGAAIAAQMAMIAQIQATQYTGRRYGGHVAAGGMYEVAEPGNPELLRYKNKTLLLMGAQSGVVEPASRIAPRADAARAQSMRVISELGFPVQPVPFVTAGEMGIRLRYTQDYAIAASRAASLDDAISNGPVTRANNARTGARRRPVKAGRR